MNFEVIKLEHRHIVSEALSKGELTTADASFVNLWLWRFARKIEIAALNGCIFVRQTLPSGEKFFLCPQGGDLKAALLDLRGLDGDGELNFRAVTEGQKELMERAAPGEFEFDYDRDHSDYLYNVGDLIDLNGRQYHSKKNFINRFATFYGINYERLNKNNAAEAAAFIERWFKLAPYAAEAEKAGILSLIENFENFNVSCAILRAQDQIAAFTASEKLSVNRAVIHIEKADGANFPGAYQAINQAHLANEYAECSIVNREEDLGLEGLRKAKLSYHPIALADKYRAKWQRKG